MITNPQRIGDDRQGWIDRGTRREKAAIDNVEVVNIVGTTVEIQHRSRWIGAKPTSSALMANGLQWNKSTWVDAEGNDMFRFLDRF